MPGGRGIFPRLTLFRHRRSGHTRCLHRIVSGYYRALSGKFPYAIYYKIEGNEVRVRRVLDCRRNPRWINKELKKG
jgi:plasmid stabilization system protein ParE